ncbi:STAS-like domain-containing protein [Paraglaciecola sp. L3A3]|uniref:STAS-like domain-containing protein n=1 Tax=Paraglaciecola sp. L3A3 TaxID=2686358 RepID=UPI00131DA2F2|nr:DUF4325 domain-containing protein [Paraglaciecola sp. L3A3]
MKPIFISLPTSDLASRKLAIIERNKIEQYISKNSIKVHLDLTNVSSISESYSDELFGVLVLKHGATKVLESIQLEGAKRHVLFSIAKVINRRRAELESSAPVKAEMAALA